MRTVGLSLPIWLVLAPLVGAAERVDLTKDGLSAWRGETGQWEVVGDAMPDPANVQRLTSKPGTGTLLNGPNGRTAHLISKSEHGDVKAHIEFMVSKDSNSGAYFMGRYEIQIFDSWEKTSPYPGIECGGIYQRWDESREEPKGYEGYSPRINASRPPGQWQSLDVIFRAPRFDRNGRKLANARFEKVVHNGVVVHADRELTGPTRAGLYADEKPTGPLMLQGDHGPVAYRNVRFEPAGPNPFFAMDSATGRANLSPRQQVQMVQRLGYTGMGCSLSDQLGEYLQELDKHQMRLFAVYTGIQLDPQSPKYSPKLLEAIELLKGRNTILWIFAQSKSHKPSDPAGDKRAKEILSELAQIADDNALRIALYPHHAFWLETVRDAVRLAKQVNRANVGVTFNLCHWLRVHPEDDAQTLLTGAMPHLFVVTINGADKAGDDWQQLIQTLDQGSYDIGGLLKTLRTVGYNGPIGFQGYGIKGDVQENLSRTMRAWNEQSDVLIAE